MLVQRGGGKSEGRQAGSQSRGTGGSAGCHGRPGELLLSPIEDVSPSLEAAEQESMSRIQVGGHAFLFIWVGIKLFRLYLVQGLCSIVCPGQQYHCPHNTEESLS